ncbi:MAG: hypothetical protein GC152_16060 [Alphaproteobacteria bacterium]|nr:hypothetical protein [Alphaproteobacteria bacterium]
MKIQMIVRHLMLAMAGIVVGLMSVSLAFDYALYSSPQSAEVERDATHYYHIVRTSFVPVIVSGTLLGLVATTAYRMIFERNWRTYLLAIGVFSLSFYYVAVVFALEDNLPSLTDFDARVASLIQIGFAHLLTWLAGWFTVLLLMFEGGDRR